MGTNTEAGVLLQYWELVLVNLIIWFVVILTTMLLIKYSTKFRNKFVGATGAMGPTGADGASAYDIAVKHGYEGCEKDWIKSQKGYRGQKGSRGESAYHIAVRYGFIGTEKEWVDVITKGSKSIYELAVMAGYDGTEEEWNKATKE